MPSYIQIMYNQIVYIYIYIYVYTLWLSNIAMENHHV